MRWYIVEDESTLDAEIDAFLSLMANDHHKEEFLTEVMRTQMRTSVHAAFKAGWLQLAFMEVDGQKAAGYLNFDYGNRIWVYNSGLDFNFQGIIPRLGVAGLFIAMGQRKRTRRIRFHARGRGLQVQVWGCQAGCDAGEGGEK